MKRILAAIGLAMCSFGAMADGNELLLMCEAALQSPPKTSEAFNSGRCYGLVQGAVDTMALVDEANKAPFLNCIPEKGVSVGQATRITVKYLKEHPEQLHQRETKLIVFAMMHAFPCTPETRNFKQ